MKTSWRWFRYLFAIFAAFLIGGMVWVGWLLSGQRYQRILTEQLGAFFGARVQVEQSQLSFHGGLGVQFDTVTVQDDGAAAPFFAADEIALLLDLSALWRGKVLFHRVDFVKPRLRVTAEGKRLLQLINRLREARGDNDSSPHWLTAGFAPTFAVQELRLYDADISYAETTAGAPVVLTGTEATLSFAAREKPTIVLRTTLKSKNGGLGQIALRAAATEAVDFEALGQSTWAGEVELSGVQLQQLGRAFGEQWPPAKFDLSGRFQGRGEGPIEFTGSLTGSDIRMGEVLLNGARLRVAKAVWAGPSPRSWLRAFAFEARIEQLRGEVGKDAAPIVVEGGGLTFQGEELVVTKLDGAYGKTSRFTDANVSLRKLFAKAGPAFDAQITTDVDLENDLVRLLTALTPTNSAAFSQVIARPRGRASGQFRIHQDRERGEPTYSGVVTLQHVGGQVLPWQLAIEDLNGDVQLKSDALFTNALTFTIDQSSLKVQGEVRDFLSARRSVDLHLTFSEVRDHTLASFFPLGKVLPQGGVLNGHLKILVSPNGQTPNFDGRIALARVRLDLLDFLQPFEVVEGELVVAGQGGTFSVKRGQLPGGAFSGRGRIESWAPLRLELSGDFPDLNLESALALDKPDDGLPKDATRDVRATLTSNRLVYEGAQVDNLRLACHWRGRQADLRIHHAEAAGGSIQGDAILWPDLDAAYLAPRLKDLDVERFFHAVGVPTKALTGKLSGEGKIYMPDWARWDNLAQWDAVLSLAVEDGTAQRLPILVRLWSALSMQGLLRLQLPSLPTEGLPFSSLTGDFAIGKGVAVTNNLSLSGNSVRIDTRGQIDLAQRTLDLRTALVPLHGITSSVAKVPLAGELLARGADYLTTLNFRVSGPYNDPSVTPLLVDTGRR